MPHEFTGGILYLRGGFQWRALVNSIHHAAQLMGQCSTNHHQQVFRQLISKATGEFEQ
jgi:hypothetical protein